MLLEMQNNINRFAKFICGVELKYKTFSTSFSMSRTYEAAVKALNKLQSNAVTIQEACRSGEIKQSDRFEKTKSYAARGKVPVDELDKLNAIHVSGTKGKGSVCVFADSILREHGYKTGFFSSPHLVEVRERIRINGKIISKDLFAKYFWECWDNLKQGPDTDMPPYFAFLTVMSFYVFLQERVDVSIIEVGIGGAYDSTNIISKPWVCGITSLGHDHLSVLGGTTESIAWNKAGILKCGVPAFTVSQDDMSTKVLVQRAKELKAPLEIVPSMESYSGEPITTLGIEGRHQFQNASLASQLCKTWLEHWKDRSEGLEPKKEMSKSFYSNNNRTLSVAETFDIDTKFKNGLQRTFWPGRSHCIKRDHYTLYLDGAHTPKSMDACSTWLRKKADQEKELLKPQTVARVLIFNCTGDRDSQKLLAPLAECNFDYAIFCTNSVIEESSKKSSGIEDYTSSVDMKVRRCHENHEIWKAMVGEAYCDLSSLNSAVNFNKTLKIVPNLVQNSCISSSVTDALHWVISDRELSISTRHLGHPPLPRVISRANHVQIVVTGSLHLVGAAMKVLGRDIIGII